MEVRDSALWKMGPTPASEAELTTLEQKIQTKIPEQYRRFLSMATDGGEPVRDLVFDVPDGSGATDLRGFYGFKPENYCLFQIYQECVPDVYPAHCLPIAEDSCGNAVLLVPQLDGSAPVGFWDHEDFEEMYKNPLKIKLADSFEEFLDILYFPA